VVEIALEKLKYSIGPLTWFAHESWETGTHDGFRKT